MRNGDVIPGVSHAVLDKRPANAVTYVMPNTCPSCGSKTHKEDDGAITYCLAGLACPAQRLGAISHFVSREAMDIDGIGDSTISALLEAGLVKTMSDLYKLRKEDIVNLDGFGESSAELLVNGVHKIKNPELRRFIYSLGIPNTGKGTSKRLAEHFGSFMAMMLASIAELRAIDDIGPTTAASIHGYLHDPVTGAEAMALYQILSPKDVVKVDTSAMKLGGKTFLVTGTLTVKREVIEKLIEEHGGVISGSVSKKLDYLIVGADAGSKLEKAEKLKTVKILDEATFRAMIA
jgi:DNA ligase (NAD+)